MAHKKEGNKYWIYGEDAALAARFNRCKVMDSYPEYTHQLDDIDRFTFAEITHNTATDKFDAIIYLDERVTNEEKCANAAVMRKAFDAWLEESGHTADPAALTEVPDP